MALAPWNVLAGGKIRTDAEEKRRLESGEGGRTIVEDWKRTPEERKVCAGLERIANEIGVKSIGSGTYSTFSLLSQPIYLNSLHIVAIAWIMHKAPRVFPIIGGRKVEHLHQNIEALSISLTPTQVKALDDIVPFDKGFPYSIFVSKALPKYEFEPSNTHHFSH